MNLYFSISEFCIDKQHLLSPEIADKILRYHICQINPIREIMGIPILVSKASGYRPVEWELARGRSGNSEHTFKDKGAADYTCRNITRLLQIFKTESDYRRIAYYKDMNFIHCDYNSKDWRQYFEVENGVWVFKENLGR